MWLGRADLEAILGFLGDIDRLERPEPYPIEVLDRLPALIPCDGVGYQEADFDARVFIANEPAETEEDDALYWAVGPCPIMDYRVRTGDLSALRMSDVVGRTRYHQLPIYREYFQPVGLDHVLDLGLSVIRTRYRSLLLVRGRDVPDFSERDRAVLEILRPHLFAREALADLRRRVVEATRAADVDETRGARSTLTPREREVVHLVAAGKTNAQIAAELWVTPGTVKTHLENVYEKLGIGSRAAAVSRVESGSPGIIQ
jgi:DNA-binding CsgD family transcriptional regulator